ncbi:MAG: F0F1 ATP synthase subunit epsilon [Bifidobacteriaceae bacterium]|jgi:F-type H+-transporting ATPase subunit epsilon|nr:F0F1 ATP synthase subunit epsilon [Bifidobacteriaceae bacterium]
MQVSLASQNGVLFSGNADFVVVPQYNGPLGILPNHEPLLTTLKQGEVRIVVGETEQKFGISSGFLSIYRNEIEVAVDVPH